GCLSWGSRATQDNEPESDELGGFHQWMLSWGSRAPQDNEPESDDYVNSPVDAELGSRSPKI
ncbi:hypothetical protein OS493_040456, partial [Desmophyllum pertusum]